MDLKSGYPWWAVKSGLMQAFPRLEQDLHCDVAVIGGGISGALVADELSAHGHDVVVVEQRDIGWGSTCASTALVQYEIDTPLVELAALHGESNARLAYLACAEAVAQFQDRASAFRDVDLRRMQSLYYASRPSHAKALRGEYDARALAGLPVQWLDRGEVRERYGFEAPCAILSTLATTVDPYRLTCRLLGAGLKRGMRVHDRSRVARLRVSDRVVRLETDAGHVVTSKHVVVAAGYEGQRFIDRKVARNRSSYAFVTDSEDPHAAGTLRDTMTWETARPYLYTRTTGDGRWLVGGADDRIDIPRRRDARVERKAGLLARQASKLQPDRPPPRPAFAWAGTFAETADGLPYFGAHPRHGGRVLFAMAYGGNGITYSMLGAGLLRAAIERRRHPLSELFGFARSA